MKQLISKIMDNPIASRLLNHGAWAMAGKFGTVILSLFVNFLLARILSPDDVGIYFLLFSIVTFGSYVGMLGLRQTIVKMIAENLDDPDRVKMIAKRIIQIALAGGLGTAIFFILFFQTIASLIFKIDLTMSVVVLVGVWILFDVFQQIISEGFRGFHNIKLASIFGGFLSSLILVIGLLFIFFMNDSRLIIVVSSMVAALLTSVTIASLMFKRQVNRVVKADTGLALPPLSKLSYKGILNISTPLMVFTITAFFLFQSDLWIVGAFGTQADVAIYGAAYRLVLLVAMPLVIVEMISPPLIAQMNAQNKLKELEKTLRNVSTIASIPSIAVIIMFMAFGSLLLGLIFGDFYRSGSFLLAILCIGQLFNVLSGSSGTTLMMTGNQKSIMNITLFCSIIMIGGSIVAVRLYGPMGVAIVKTSSLLILNVLLVLVTKRKVGIWTHIKWFTKLSLAKSERYELKRKAN